MKLNILLPLLFLFIVGNLNAQEVPLEFWNFDDPSGTDLNDLSNSGTLGSNWNFNTPEDLTNGSGQFVIGSGAGVYTRKLPDGANEDGATNKYAFPITTGKYLFEVTFASWTADAASVGDSWNFKIQDSTGANVANIIWQVDTASTTRIRASTIATAGTQQYFRNYNSTGLTQSTAVTLAIEFDFDNDTVRYLLDGVEEFSATDFSGDGISGWVYSKGGVWTSTATSLTLESMGLTDLSGEPPVVPGLHVEEQFRYRNGGGDIGTTAVDATGAAGGFGSYSNYDGVDTLNPWDFTIFTGTGFNSNGNEGFVPTFNELDNTTWRSTTTADDSLWRSATGGTGLAIYSGTGLSFGLMPTLGGSLKRSSQNSYSTASRTLNSTAQSAVTIPSTTTYIAMVMEVFSDNDTQGEGGTNDNNEAGNFGFAFSSEDFGVAGATPQLIPTPNSAGIGFRAFAPDPLDPIDSTSARLTPAFFKVYSTGTVGVSTADEYIYFSEGDTMMIIAEIEWGPAVGSEPEEEPVILQDTVNGDLDIVMPTAEGYSYQLKNSSDLSGWTNSGDAIEGTGAAETWNRPVPLAGEKAFYQVQTESLTRITLYRVTLAQAATTYPDLSAFDSVSFFGSIDSSILDRITFYDNRLSVFDEIRIGNTPSDVAPGIIVPPAP
ncbi:hypothetical protein G0Q06_12035 [Puniceicoccales bacterium CK1056]|uniref:Uncharacterized protein n=1 Tax=Oceanipulchritudo coccoides TaxID=2706888 RepID=A0A6B2M5W4_9BACT|nr:hypothetical protein [Oceanipulchritudo coccoides]NDV63185.1 hypothetical protein [Oceanipulchritudo coccoides]